MDNTKQNIFLGLLPDKEHLPEFKEKFTGFQPIESAMPFRWEDVRDLHITMGYMKNILPEDIETCARAFDTAQSVAPFSLTIKQVSLFGTAVCLELEPYPALKQCHEILESELISAFENKYQFHPQQQFRPHITIGRFQVSHRQDIKKGDFDFLRSYCEHQFKEYQFHSHSMGLMTRVNGNIPKYQIITLYQLNSNDGENNDE